VAGQSMLTSSATHLSTTFTLGAHRNIRPEISSFYDLIAQLQQEWVSPAEDVRDYDDHRVMPLCLRAGGGTDRCCLRVTANAASWPLR
jgi:hypothetical protein